MRGAATATALLVAGLLAIAGCGGDSDEPVAIDEPRHPLTSVVHRLQDARERGDYQGICDRMTRSAQLEAGRIAHKTPTTCVRDVRRVFEMIDEGGGWEGDGSPPVARVATRAAAATAVVADDSWRAAAPFVKDGGGWRLDGFYGAGAPARRRAEVAAGRRPFPPAGQKGALEVTDAGGNSCASAQGVSGGCRVELSTKLAPIGILTPFGAFKFSDCRVDIALSVDGEGRTLTEQWDIEARSPRVTDGCGDVNPCVRPGTFVYRPWKGRLRPSGDDDAYLLEMQMCLKTCVGSFVGDYVLRLERDDGSWRAKPTDLGATGFLIDGDLAVSGDQLEMHPPKGS